jgi:hypothetical protein
MRQRTRDTHSRVGRCGHGPAVCHRRMDGHRRKPPAERHRRFLAMGADAVNIWDEVPRCCAQDVHPCKKLQMFRRDLAGVSDTQIRGHKPTDYWEGCCPGCPHHLQRAAVGSAILNHSLSARARGSGREEVVVEDAAVSCLGLVNPTLCNARKQRAGKRRERAVELLILANCCTAISIGEAV